MHYGVFSFLCLYFQFFCDVHHISPLPTNSFIPLLRLSFAPLPSSKLQVVALATAGRRSPFREVVGSPKALNPLSPDQQTPNQEPMSPQGFAAGTVASTAGNRSGEGGSGGSASNLAPPARSWQVGSFRRGSGGGNGGGYENDNENDGPDLDNAAGIQVKGRAANHIRLLYGNIEKKSMDDKSTCRRENVKRRGRVFCMWLR